MLEPGEGKTWIDPSSPTAESLRDLVFDRRWLNSLTYYVRNRHTGNLEVSVSFLYISTHWTFMYMYMCDAASKYMCIYTVFPQFDDLLFSEACGLQA